MTRDPEKQKRIWKAAGKRIQLAREGLYMSQEAFCEKLFNVELKDPARTLRRYENEGFLRWKTIKTFAKFFNVSEDILTDLELPDDAAAKMMIASRERFQEGGPSEQAPLGKSPPHFGSFTSPSDTSGVDSLAAHLKNYPEWLARSEWTKIKRVLHRSSDVDVKKLYVELFLIDPDTYQQHAPADITAPKHFITAESLLARTGGRAVIVGGPGSGKTTLVKWICCYLLSEKERRSVYPLPVRLKDFAEATRDDSTTTLLPYVLTYPFREAGVELPKTLWTSAHANDVLKGIQFFFLLDGWDEVPRDMRRKVLETVNRDTSAIPAIITTRQSGIPELLRDDETIIYELGPLTDTAAAELCFRYGEMSGTGFVEEILDRIESTPSLWAMAGNPYLLTLLCEVVAYDHKRLPELKRCSPAWVLGKAIQLIVKDHNALSADWPLTSSDSERLMALAFQLSFGERGKLTTFEPEKDLGLPFNQFTETALAHSRFFNVFRSQVSIFEFTHLRLQEYLAAQAAKTSGLTRDMASMKRYLLSLEWREESRFIGALLTDGNGNDVYWQTLADLLSTPDQAGEIIRRIAGILAAAGVSDGGTRLLGQDVRSVLWNSIDLDKPLVAEDLRALLELDPGYLLDRTIDLQRRNESSLEESRILETVYRLIPLRMRKAGLDELLGQNPNSSWLIGLPGRSFSVNACRDLTKTALDSGTTIDKRVEAIRELGTRRASECVKPLVQLLDDNDEEISSTTAETLAKIGGRKAAEALANRLITPRENFASLLLPLINALSIDHYGILEPHSRDLLVTAIKNCKEESHLGILLSVVAGTPIPNPPHRILDILKGSRKYSLKTREAAANVFAGITDETFLLEALSHLTREQDRNLRRLILKSVRLIPIGHEVEDIWAFFNSPDRSGKEKKHTLALFCRTLKRFPNHPIGPRVRDYLRAQLLALANGIGGKIERDVIRNAVLISQDEEVKKSLISIVRDERLSDPARKEAVAALSKFKLNNAELTELQQQFDHIFQSPDADPALLISLAETLVAAQPQRALDLLRKLDTMVTASHKAARSAIITFTQRNGYILFGSDVIGPDGNIVG